MTFTKQLLTIAISVLISAGISFGLTTHYMAQAAQTAQVDHTDFKVVDLQELSQRLLLSIQDQVDMKKLQVHPDLIEVIAQTEATKMLNHIQKHSPDKIILTKSNILFSPKQYDITEDISSMMGVSEIDPDRLKQFINSQLPVQIPQD